jgi:hypothetical protein
VGLDQPLGFDHRRAAVGRLARDTHHSVGLVVGLDCPAEELVDARPLLDHVDAVGEVVEHLGFGRQVRGFGPESPSDVSRGEHRMRLMQPHVRVRVDPHSAHARPTVHQDHSLIAGQVLTGDEQRVQPGDAGANDADVATFNWHGHNYLPSPANIVCQCKGTA